MYRGVRRRNNNKWVCEVRVPNKSTRIWLGTYPTPEMAARAHDVAALTLRGKSACLNFADSVWRLPLPESTNADEIRRVAAEAAKSFAAEDKDNSYEKLSVNAVTDHDEVCNNNDSVGVRVMEDTNKGNDKPLQGLYVDEVEGVSAFEDMQDWIRSMAEEPLRSPPPFAVRYGIMEWNDVDVDAEVSLWSFAI